MLFCIIITIFLFLNLLCQQNNIIISAKMSSMNKIFVMTLMLLFLVSVNTIKLTKPIQVSPDTESSPANHIFYFSLDIDLPMTGYLMIVFNTFTTTADPYTCISLTNAAAIATCQNLQSATSLTINQTSVNSINPNIDASKTVVIQFSTILLANTEYSMQIITNNVLPSIGSITSNFEAYTISGTGIMLQENWNLGHAYLSVKQNKVLNVLNINDLSLSTPGLTQSSLTLQFNIGVQVPTPLSRIKFIVSGQFTFLESSIVTTEAVTGSPPQILTSQLLSPNIIVTTFNESFTVGRRFRVLINNIQCPLKIVHGFVSIYSLPYNSNSPLQVKELSFPIDTVHQSLTVTVLTAQRSSVYNPIQFYMSTTQYIAVQIILPRDCNVGFVIQLYSPQLVIHQGSLYAIASSVNGPDVTYKHVDSHTVQVRGFPLILSGSTITVTMRVQIDANPLFDLSVSIDEQTYLSSPIMYGQAPTQTAALPTTFVSGLKGSQSETNRLSSMTSGSSSLYFTINPSFATYNGSYLQVYVNKNLHTNTSAFNTAASCLVNGVAEPCTITYITPTNVTLTKITIASNSSYNLFPQSTSTTIQINHLVFDAVSSHTLNIYQLYYKLTVSQSTTQVSKSCLLLPQVIPQRNTLLNFKNYFSNLLNNTGNNFPSVMRLVSSDSNEWNWLLQPFEKRIISIFAYQGWKNFFNTISNGDTYTCSSNLDNIKCTFVEGTTNSLSSQYFLDWDHIDVILPGTQSTNKFSIIFPTAFRSASLSYEILVGVINTQTRVITYTKVEPKPILGNPTYFVPDTASIISKNLASTMQMLLAGKAGSYISNVNIQVVPSGATYSATLYSAALMIVSDWQFFDSLSQFNSVFLGASADPSFSNDQQKPVFLKISDTQTLTYIPIKTAATYGSAFNITLDNIKLPYTHDLPYYSIYLVNENGNIDSYNQFINQNKNAFYSTYLKSLSIICQNNQLGTVNTFCSIDFTPYNQIESGGTIYITFTGMYISSNLCKFQQVTPSIADLNIGSCQSNTEKTLSIVTLSNTNRLTALQKYRLILYGISIQNDTNIHYIDFELRDPSGSYNIEIGQRIFLTSVYQPTQIKLNQVKYIKNNPIVISGLIIDFQLPRQLLLDENFAVVLSKDLSNLNTISSKLQVVLERGDGTVIPALWILNVKNYQIVFENLVGILTADTYKLSIYGIKMPSNIASNLITLIYLRYYDASYTVTNEATVTSSFPVLVDKINSLITLQPYINTEGFSQQLDFTIIHQSLPVDDNTVWLINFPRYYSQDLWNEDYKIYCMIQTSKIDCEKDSTTPYQMIVHSSPRLIDVGVAYHLRVYGINCPRQSYVNGNAQYVTESIFLGISENSTAESYIEYSQLFMTNTIINPQIQPGYGLVTVVGIQSSNNQAFQSTYFTINMMCTIQINPNQWVYLNFPKEFDNFNDIPLVVQFGTSISNDETLNTTVVNRRISFQISTVTITSNTVFYAKISSLPTPKTDQIIDMNKLEVIIASSDKTTSTAASIQKKNLVDDIAFTSSELKLIINNYNIITMTAGTYSSPVPIAASDTNTFISNMKIVLVSQALVFNPNPTYLYLGEKEGSFQIGGSQNLIPTYYAFDIIKTEASIKSFYSSLSRYGVLVSNVPKQIVLPTSINVPRGGCSIPIKLLLTNAPYNDVSIYFQYDYTLFTTNTFWLNEETSNIELTFLPTILDNWITFCSDPSISMTTFPVNAFLRGQNQASYNLSSSFITINIVSNATTAITPTCTIVPNNILKTYASFNITVNNPGLFYYQLKLSPFTQPISLVELKAAIKSHNTTLQSQSDYFNQIYLQDRDHRLGMIPTVSGVNLLGFDNLLPQRVYTFCGYFQNQHRQSTQASCQEITTKSWGIIKQATISFNYTLYSKQLNDVLCFFVKQSDSKIDQIISLEGKSCSLNSAPQNYYYSYPGQTISYELTNTTIYLIESVNLTADVSLTSFKNIYNGTAFSNASRSAALADFSINYITSSTLGTDFTGIAAINAKTSEFLPKFTHSDPYFNSTSKSLVINDLKLSESGSIYFITVLHKQIFINNITWHADVNIRPQIIPSSDKILNCLDGTSQKSLHCKRVVLQKQNTQNITFQEVEQNSVYFIYYVVANSYPLRPIVSQQIGKIKITTKWEQKLILGITLGIMILLF